MRRSNRHCHWPSALSAVALNVVLAIGAARAAQYDEVFTLDGNPDHLIEAIKSHLANCRSIRT